MKNEQDPHIKIMPLPGDSDWDEELWRTRAIRVMETKEFGWYCHEGGDLLQDLLDYYKVGFDPTNVNGIDSLEWLLSSLVYEIEGANCEFCSQENDDILSANPADYLEEALLSWKPNEVTAEQVVYTALLRSGHNPPFLGQPVGELHTVAQDLIDNVPRIGDDNE